MRALCDDQAGRLWGGTATGDKEIANELGISMSTLRTHGTAVYEKLHV